MPTNAQLLAEIDRLNQAMAERTRVPSNLPKFTGKRGKDVREWLFQVENVCSINNITIEDASTCLPGIAGEEHTWEIFREHVLQQFEASNYQAVLREKLQLLKQTADIESYNGPGDNTEGTGVDKREGKVLVSEMVVQVGDAEGERFGGAGAYIDDKEVVSEVVVRVGDAKANSGGDTNDGRTSARR
ncbi:Hypothetical protein PHPALM_16867 [Phytophthora palmivora]|uniref:Ty3 transposon capsid-like protein domain-containing protein n=1 Tax=Phytophthora palmivora TaxID=4796 RepID=A0A2P4XNP8_9STRA|nr:Hypothetical protein PHPALM_16867 [Phytophthora palmivora]